MPLEAEYLGTVMTWNGHTRSELCSQTGCVEVVAQEWVAGNLAQVGAGCSLHMQYRSHLGASALLPPHLMLCSAQL